MADREKIIEGLKDAIKRADYDGGIVRMSVEVCQIIIDVLEDRDWIPFVKRILTDDEEKIHPDWCYILEGSVPEDEEEILLYRPWKNSEGYIITMDQFMNNGTECYLDGAGDIENGMFWMHKPEPPKEDE